MKLRLTLTAAFVVTILLVTGGSASDTKPSAKEGTMSFTLTSPAFPHEEPIPGKYTCDGEDLSPALIWTGIPRAPRASLCSTS